MFRTILFLSLYFISSISVYTQIPSEIEGSWQGTVIEKGRSNPYHVSMNIYYLKKGEIAGTIWYKDYNCGGDLKFLGINKHGIYVFREILTSKTNCIDNGYVTGKLVNGQFSFIWKHEHFKHQAKGLLNRDYS